MKTLLKYIKPQKFKILACMLLLIIQAAASLAVPYFIGDLVETGIQKKGIVSDIPEYIGSDGMKCLKAVLPSDKFSFIENEYQKDGKIYVLKENYDKNIKAVFENCAYSSVLLAKSYLGDSASDITSGKISTYSRFFSFGMLSKLLDKTDGFSEELREEEYKISQNAPASVKSEMLSMLLPYFYKDAGIDVGSLQKNRIIKCGIEIAVCAVVTAVCMIAVGKTASYISTETEHSLRKEIMEHTSGFSKKEIEQTGKNELAACAVTDTAQIATLIDFGLRIFLYTPFVCIGGTLMTFKINSVLGVTVLLTVAAIFLLMAVIYKITLPSYEALQLFYGKLVKKVRSFIDDFFSIRISNRLGYEKNEFMKYAEEVRKNEFRIFRSVFFAIASIGFISDIIMVVIIIRGGTDLLNTALSIGDIIAFLQYSLLIVSSFTALGAVIIFAPRAMAAVKRIAKALSISCDAAGGETQTIQCDHLICVSDAVLDFGKRKAKISFFADKNELIGVTGATGSGKSTFFNLLSGYIKPDSGIVTINGKGKVNSDDIKDLVSFVPGKPQLFSGTVMENMLYMGAENDRKTMTEALKNAQVDFLNETEPLSTMILNKASGLSGVQKSRLNIAGALASKASVYIFDDCFTSIDPVIEQKIMDTVCDIKKSSVVFVVSHNEDTLKRCDRIIEFKDLEIVSDNYLKRGQNYG